MIQLESAMGAAIESFPGARLLGVPRTRFVPVKTTNDLLVLRSDVYRLTEEMVVEPVPERARALPVRRARQALLRSCSTASSAASRPARRRCGRPSGSSVSGDVTFGAGVVVRGAVELEPPKRRCGSRTGRCWRG